MPRPRTMVFLGFIGAGVLSALTIASAYLGRPICVLGMAILQWASFAAFAMAMLRWGRGIYDQMKQDTRRAAMEADMQRSLAEESRKNVLSTVSHDLRTPMTSIQMAIHLLIEDAASRLTPRQLELLTGARDEAERLHQMTEELLRKARGEEASV